MALLVIQDMVPSVLYHKVAPLLAPVLYYKLNHVPEIGHKLPVVLVLLKFLFDVLNFTVWIGSLFAKPVLGPQPAQAVAVAARGPVAIVESGVIRIAHVLQPH